MVFKAEDAAKAAMTGARRLRSDNTPDQRPDVEAFIHDTLHYASSFASQYEGDGSRFHTQSIEAAAKYDALIAYIKALEARQVKLEAEIRRRWVNSLVKQGAAFDSATRNVASRPVLDSDGEGNG